MSEDEIALLLAMKIEEKKRLLEGWRKPTESALFEILRGIDSLFFENLFYPVDASKRTPLAQYTMSSWGVNKALSLLMPNELWEGSFRLLPSSPYMKTQANEFLLQCGILQRAETLHGWLCDGLLTATLDKLPVPLSSGIDTVLVLKSNHPSMFSEVVSRTHRSWVSDLTMKHDGSWERDIRDRHVAIETQLEECVRRWGNWGISYATTKKIDDHFLECGQIYLRRMWSQDLLGTDDTIGGERFGDYLGVLAALAGRMEKHLCFAAILKRRHPELELRNILTTSAPCTEFVTGLAAHLDADHLQVQKLLSCLTLGPDNLHAHAASAETAWAPIVRASHNHYILPMYGMDTNPFLFLLTDLRAKYPTEWFSAANNRERRWIQELRYIFPEGRWVVNDRNLNLRKAGSVITDVDYIVYDKKSNELAIFQLKWQQPVGIDNRARRSAGKNLLSQCNDWIQRVTGWLNDFGSEELAKRAGIEVLSGVRIELFVIARYNAYFTGFSNRDARATWADWNHLMKARVENPGASIGQLAATLTAEADEISKSYRGESYVLPLDNLAVILNPLREPARR